MSKSAVLGIIFLVEFSLGLWQFKPHEPTSTITPKLQTMEDNNSEDGNGIDGSGSEFEVKRKWNGNGHEKRCYGEENEKILEL